MKEITFILVSISSLLKDRLKSEANGEMANSGCAVSDAYFNTSEQKRSYRDGKAWVMDDVHYANNTIPPIDRVHALGKLTWKAVVDNRFIQHQNFNRKAVVDIYHNLSLLQ